MELQNKLPKARVVYASATGKLLPALCGHLCDLKDALEMRTERGGGGTTVLEGSLVC